MIGFPHRGSWPPPSPPSSPWFFGSFGKKTVVDFRLLKDRNFAISTFALFILGFVLYGSTIALPLFLQTLLGYTATQSGMALSWRPGHPGDFRTAGVSLWPAPDDASST